MSINNNITVLNSAEGQFTIAPGQSKLYKSIELFGYKHIDWSTIVNQAIISVIDRVSNLEDGGTGQFVFDLESYTAAEDSKRTQEFNIWKSNLQQLNSQQIQTEIQGVSDLINQEITNRENQAQEIRNTLDALPDEYNERFNTFKSDIETVIQTSLQDSRTGVQSLVSELSESLSAAMGQIEGLNSNFVTRAEAFDQKVVDFQMEISETLSAFKTAMETQINDELNTMRSDINDFKIAVDQKLEEFKFKLTALDNKLSLVVDQDFEDLITPLVNEYISTTLSTQMTTILNRVGAVEQQMSDLSQNLALDLQSTVSSVDEKINEFETTLNQNILLLNQEDNDIKESFNTLNATVSNISNSVDANAINATFEDIEYSRNFSISDDYNFLKDDSALHVIAQHLKANTESNNTKHSVDILNLINKYEELNKLRFSLIIEALKDINPGVTIDPDLENDVSGITDTIPEITDIQLPALYTDQTNNLNFFTKGMSFNLEDYIEREIHSIACYDWGVNAYMNFNIRIPKMSTVNRITVSDGDTLSREWIKGSTLYNVDKFDIVNDTGVEPDQLTFIREDGYLAPYVFQLNEHVDFTSSLTITVEFTYNSHDDAIIETIVPNDYYPKGDEHR